MRQGRIDAGMSTEPTVSRLIKSGDARLLVDLRTPQATEAELGGQYPAACLYMTRLWTSAHPAQAQQLATALVLALRYIAGHSAQEIAAQMPPEFFGGDRALYVEALQASLAMFSADGVMPPGGPATVLKVLKAVDRAVAGKTIDLSKTYTTEFARAVPR
jgi:NitT/TauT family transport system substrate-binding protein